MRVNSTTIVFSKIISVLQIVFATVNLFFWGVGGVGAFLTNDIEVSGVLIAVLFCLIAGIIL